MLKNKKRIISVACLLTIGLGSTIAASCKTEIAKTIEKQQENNPVFELKQVSLNNDKYDLSFKVNNLDNKTIALVLHPKNDKNNKIISDKVTVSNNEVTIGLANLSKEVIYELDQVQVFEVNKEAQTINLNQPIDINLNNDTNNKTLTNVVKNDKKLEPFADNVVVGDTNGLNSLLRNKTTLVYQKDNSNIEADASSFTKENLVKKYGSQTSYFSNLDKEVKNFNESLQISSSDKEDKELIPVDTSVKDNQLSIEFNSNYNNKSVEINLRSLNPAVKTSKVLKTEIKENKATFDLKDLVNLSHQFMLTTIKVDNQYIDLEYNPEYLVTFKPSTKPELINFSFYTENNQLYGSGILKTTENDLNLLNKQFVFNFKPKADENNDHIAVKKLVVNYKDLWKFAINNIFSNVLYELSSIKVVEPNLTSAEIDVDLNDQDIKFSFNQQYQQANLTSLILEQENKEVNLDSATRLLTKKLNLNSQALNELLSKTSEHNQIPYSSSNFNALVNYYFDKKSTSSTIYSSAKEVELIKDNKVLAYNVLMGKELLSNQIFNIDQSKKTATLNKDLSKFTNLKDLDPENVMFSFVFELDPNSKPLNLNTRLSSYESANSKVRINVPYALLLKQKQLSNVDFILDYKNESTIIQSLIRKEIIKKVQFDLKLENNILSLEIKAKDTQINNSLAAHNLASNQSVFVSNSDFYVHYLGGTKLSFNEKPVDALSHGLNEVSVNHYDLSKNKTPGEKNSTKRLFVEDNSKGIQAARERTFVLNQNFDGTWNMIGKVKPNDDNDHRYYVGTNWHIWDVVIRRFYKPTTEYQKIDLGGDVLLNTPTLISRDETDRKRPLYTNDNPDKSNVFDMYWKLRYKNQKHAQPDPDDWYKESERNLSKDPNSYSVHFDYGEHPITVKLVRDYIDPINRLHYMKDNQNEDISYNRFRNARYYSKLDFAVAELDVSWFFVNFAEQAKKKLEEYTYKNKKLTKEQKAVVDFILNWKNLPSLELSKQQYNFTPSSNLNFYLAAFPNEQSANADAPRNANSDRPIRRYREYLLAHHVNMRFDVPYDGASFIPIMVGFWEKNTDLAAGSSGAFVYDHEGKLAGVNVAGDGDMINPYRSRDYFMLTDNQLTSFYGNEDLVNQQSFYHHVKRLSWLYPNKYQDIFASKKNSQ
ncbi:hypothetical protein JM47_03045 [Ureaplasma diversum]|uniref:DUF31 domain-containing protein n=1 Tax=Ureaplasma diversum TaxID=42094 RepID=A0A0C5RC89_9BACT|nr:hypothetical protein [Ureaplasma diversum]AJQ45521.1 hypothetical protein JM47_03045 [Ureaplasma diversum]